MELINILIRTGNRRTQFFRCLKSVLNQRYDNLRIIISVDRDCNYIPEELEIIRVIPNTNTQYFYDEYLNDLKALVTEGYILVLDDDDILTPDCLVKLDLTALAILVKLNRAGQIYPSSLDFRRGMVGFPNLILHHSLSHIPIHGNGQGDYWWIKEVEKITPLNYQDVIVVYSFNRGHGK